MFLLVISVWPVVLNKYFFFFQFWLLGQFKTVSWEERLIYLDL